MLFCTSPLFAQKNVAVLEIERRPEVANEISRSEAMEITGVIRNATVRTLPRGQFNVMTSETVQAMGGAVLAECFDETCVIALGRTIDAEYVMRGVLSKFRAMFTLNIEMFETEYGNLVATSEPVRSENLEDLLNISGFATTEMLETFLGTSGAQTPQTVSQSRPEPRGETQIAPQEPTRVTLSQQTHSEIVVTRKSQGRAIRAIMFIFLNGERQDVGLIDHGSTITITVPNGIHTICGSNQLSKNNCNRYAVELDLTSERVMLDAEWITWTLSFWPPVRLTNVGQFPLGEN